MSNFRVVNVPNKRVKKIAFVDRDSVLNVDYGHVGTENRLKLYGDSIAALKYLSSIGYGLIIVTNQSGIARGYYSENQFHSLMSIMLKFFSDNGINFLAYYFCPHHPAYSIGEGLVNCECRKPKPGMILAALTAYKVSASNCVMFGDKKTDVLSARAAGLERAYKITRRESHLSDRAFVDLVETELHD